MQIINIKIFHTTSSTHNTAMFISAKHNIHFIIYSTVFVNTNTIYKSIVEKINQVCDNLSNSLRFLIRWLRYRRLRKVKDMVMYNIKYRYCFVKYCFFILKWSVLWWTLKIQKSKYSDFGYSMWPAKKHK